MGRNRLLLILAAVAAAALVASLSYSPKDTNDNGLLGRWGIKPR